MPARYTYEYVLRLLLGGGLSFAEANRLASAFPNAP